ncbi:MAG: sigma-70 family RNA polymerase sigma factor [Gammaproteobacteria bacterium]
MKNQNVARRSSLHHEVGRAVMTNNLTQWLRDSRDGEAHIAPEIHDFVCDRLNMIARHVRKGWPRDATMDTHSLVQEFFLRYLKAKNIYVADRRHFFNLAATMMRQIFINSARNKSTEKRGGGVPDLELEDYMLMDLRSPESVLLVDQLLDELEKQRPLAARAFIHRHYAQLKIGEIAEALETSESSVKRHLKFANGFLMRHVMADTV